MRVPVADSRTKVLVGRPHVGEAHSISLGQFSSSVSCLHTFADLIWILPLHREFRSEFVIGHYFFGRLGIEADRRSKHRIVDEIPELRGSIRRSREPAHHHANKTVVSLMKDLEPGGGEHLDRCTI